MMKGVDHWVYWFYFLTKVWKILAESRSTQEGLPNIQSFICTLSIINYLRAVPVLNWNIFKRDEKGILWKSGTVPAAVSSLTLFEFYSPLFNWKGRPRRGTSQKTCRYEWSSALREKSCREWKNNFRFFFSATISHTADSLIREKIIVSCTGKTIFCLEAFFLRQSCCRAFPFFRRTPFQLVTR